MARWTVVLALSVFAVACSAEVPGPRPPGPVVRFPVGDTSDTAEGPLGGRLILQGDCLLVSRIDRQLAIWPRGYSFRSGDEAVLREDGTVLTRVGGWIWGEVATLPRVDAEALVDTDLPTECGGANLGERDYIVFERVYDHPLPDQTEVLFPVADTIGSGDAGVGRAPLRIEGDCVLLGNSLFVWPWWTSFRASDGAVVDLRDGSVMLRVGERVLAGGGGNLPRESAEDLVGYELPDRCGEVELNEDFFFVDRIETRRGYWEYGRAGPGEPPA